MVHTAKTQPATFFAVCARLIGPEVKLTIEQSSTWQLERPGLGDHARDCRRRGKTAVPDAANRPAGAVLEHVLSALKASDAKVLNCPKND